MFVVSMVANLLVASILEARETSFESHRALSTIRRILAALT